MKHLRIDLNNMLYKLNNMMGKETTINKETLYKKLIKYSKMEMMFLRNSLNSKKIMIIYREKETNLKNNLNNSRLI